MKYTTPVPWIPAFTCPHCNVFAQQMWHIAGAKPIYRVPEELSSGHTDPQDVTPSVGSGSSIGCHSLIGILVSSCTSCERIVIWNGRTAIYPTIGFAAEANPDMPYDVRRDYDEASAIVSTSPRGAAALLRLAIQKLCKELNQPGKNINDDIGALVKEGLDTRVQQALDAVRVIGNNAVHPGQLDLRDDRATAEALFKLINLIVDKTISEPKHVAEVYASLPESAIKAIEWRDREK